ncbi:MAG: transglutaminaseTgpA domain-containing protein [Myxococcota bacterium]|nr:transglutaminaseTgpA domain-containing protein [Myxococcota bacterium]
MKLMLWYQLGFACTVVVGMLSVLLGGELPWAFWFALVTPVGMFPLRLRGTALAPWLAPVIGALSLLMAAWVLQARGMEAALLGGAVALMGITVGRLMTAETMAHDLQVILLTLLLFFAGSVVHTEVTYGLALIAYSIFVVWALVTRQLVIAARSEGERMGEAAATAQLVRTDVVTPGFLAATSALAVVLILSTSVLFVLFPRVGLRAFGFWKKTGTHLPGEVSLQGQSAITNMSDAVVARVRGIPFEEFGRGLYLRGPVYDELTRDGFRDSFQAYQEPLDVVMMRPREPVFGYEVFAHPIGLPILLTLGHVTHAEVIYGGTSNPSTRVRAKGVNPSGNLVPTRLVTGPLRYRVEGTVDRGSSEVKEPLAMLEVETEPNMRRFLALPESIDPRIVPLANSLVGALELDSAKVLELVRHFRSSFTYTLEQPTRNESDPVASFLFEAQSGHCEYFATALAMLLRGQGIPSRVVGGYHGGSWDPDGWTVFTGKHAHVWVEWFHQEQGWLIADATPVGSGERELLTGFAALYERMRRMWDERVVEFGLTEQFHLIVETAGAVGPMAKRIQTWVKESKGWVALGFVLVLVGLVGWWIRQERHYGPRQMTALGAALERMVVRLRDAPLALDETLREAVVELVERPEIDHVKRTRVVQALDFYERERFGGVALRRAEITEMIRDVNAV